MEEMAMACLFSDIVQAFVAWPGIFVQDFLRYLIPASVAFLGLWVWRGHPWRRRKIQPAFAPVRQRWRELAFSLLTVLIFSLNGLGIVTAVGAGITQIYGEIAEYGWAYWAFSLVAIILLHDTYFYWTHRLLHTRPLFRLFHRTHHRSHNPSPWAAYAFAPGEAVVHAVFLTGLIFVMPLHSSVIIIFLIHMIVRNVIGHCGFELLPRGTAAHPIGGIITTTTHHDLHHSSGRGNYGLYFSWWDRLMGTEHPRYRETFDRVTATPLRSDVCDVTHPIARRSQACGAARPPVVRN
jgi:sterol desaturase/sphingolipid hydroxylase (fatty acid hydroxylase superfamily)